MTEREERSRRDFLVAGGVTTAAALSPAWARASTPEDRRAAPHNPVTARSMPTRNLGRTGHRVGIFSLGGQSALERGRNDEVAVPIIERALDLGVNYIDTSSIYGGPERWSERYIGQVMKQRRSEAFLATKTIDRTRDGSMRMLESSLELLQTDHIDLWQLHDVGLPEDVDAIFGPGGAMEALTEAREQGVVSFLGITGHYRPEALLEALRRHPFDAILLAVNAADRYHHSFGDELLPAAVERRMGIIGMKVPARGRLLSSWVPAPIEKQKHSWEGGAVLAHRPGTLVMREAMDYALSLPVSTVIVGCDSVAQLEENVELARGFTPLTGQQMAALEEKAQPVSKQACFFRYVSRG